MYVIKPASYNRWASIMVFFTEKPSRVLAACCKVEVISGGLGRD